MTVIVDFDLYLIDRKLRATHVDISSFIGRVRVFDGIGDDLGDDLRNWQDMIALDDAVRVQVFAECDVAGKSRHEWRTSAVKILAKIDPNAALG